MSQTLNGQPICSATPLSTWCWRLALPTSTPWDGSSILPPLILGCSHWPSMRAEPHAKPWFTGPNSVKLVGPLEAFYLVPNSRPASQVLNCLQGLLKKPCLCIRQTLSLPERLHLLGIHVWLQIWNFFYFSFLRLYGGYMWPPHLIPNDIFCQLHGCTSVYWYFNYHLLAAPQPRHQRPTCHSGCSLKGLLVPQPWPCHGHNVWVLTKSLFYLSIKIWELATWLKTC